MQASLMVDSTPQQKGAGKIVKVWLLGGSCSCIFHPVNRGTSVGFTSPPGKGKDMIMNRDRKHKGKRMTGGTVKELKGVDSGPKGRQNPKSIAYIIAANTPPTAPSSCGNACQYWC